jgi:hypothetical protein
VKEGAGDTRATCRSGGLAGMVRLNGPHGYEGVGTLSYCVANDEFQLPDLVATPRETCEVIPLHPKVDTAYVFTKPLKPMKRGWKKRQLFARETVQRLKPIRICESSFHDSLLLEKPSQDRKNTRSECL